MKIPVDRNNARFFPDTIERQLKDKNVELYLSDKMERYEDKDDHTVVYLDSGRRLQADMVVLAIGVRPESTLARASGLELGSTGGIKVDSYLQTSDPDIYAVGDAIEVTQFIRIPTRFKTPAFRPEYAPPRPKGQGLRACSGGDANPSTPKSTGLKAGDKLVSGLQALIPLAGPANRQGRMAADNIVFGNKQQYRGTQGTSILKAFDLAAATTGLNEKQLTAAGIPFLSCITHSGSHASYYPGAKQISLKLLFSPDGKILGAQAVGADGADKRIDVISTAIHGNLTVEDLAELELAYAPPFGSAKDPVNIAGYVAINVLNQSHELVEWSELHRSLETKTAGLQLIPAEIEAERSGNCTVSAVLIAPGVEMHTLNAVGLQCPGPIMKTYKAREALDAGELLEVTVSDPAFGRDIRAWAKKTGNDVMSIKTNKGLIIVLLRKNKIVPVAALSVATRDKLTLVVFSDDLDKVMASMIIANGALAMGKPVSLLFTFWGLDVLRRGDAPARNKPLMDRMFSSMLPSGVDKGRQKWGFKFCLSHKPFSLLRRLKK